MVDLSRLALPANECLTVQVVANMPDPGRIPGPVVIPNCVSMLLSWSLANGKRASNAMHFSNPASAVIDEALADTINNAFIADARFTTWMSRVGSECSYLGLALKDLSVANNAFHGSTAAAVPGNYPVDPVTLPPEVAFVVTERTNLGGRENRGRVYLPGVSRNLCTTGAVADPTVVADAPDLLNALGDAVAGAGTFAICIAQPARQSYTSPDTGRVIPARDANFIDVVAFSSRDNIFDSQRRRSQP